MTWFCTMDGELINAAFVRSIYMEQGSVFASVGDNLERYKLAVLSMEDVRVSLLTDVSVIGWVPKKKTTANITEDART